MNMNQVLKAMLILACFFVFVTPVLADSGLPDVINPEPDNELGPFDDAYVSPGPGFNVATLQVGSGVKVDEVTIPYPLGASRFLAMCPINHYVTYGEADVAWHCTWEFDSNWNQATFTLWTNYDDGDVTGVTATAVLISLDDFYLVDGVDFTVYNDSTKNYQLDYMDGDVFIASVDTYETNADDDFSFAIYPDESTNAFDYSVSAWNGNDGSYIHGQIQVLRPVYANAQGYIDSVNLANNKSATRHHDITPYGRTAYFNSVYKYITNDDDDFQFFSWVDAEGTFFVETERGNSGSSVAIESIVLKR
ncbi:MAG: hypothetical protein H8E28_01165 [Anaerolineae bacterium]|nr:hypothetical protein [Anaerolineae bacterium]MBL6965870.1 hypothetical protein [Anaerolineales bacterium]